MNKQTFKSKIKMKHSLTSFLTSNRCNHYKKLILLLLAFTSSINFTYAQWQRTNGPNGAGQVTCIAVSGMNIFAGTDKGIFLSTDTGTTWTAVGFTDTIITALAMSGMNIFAGTDIGVYTSPNNGASWSKITAGLLSFQIGSLAAMGPNIFVGTIGVGLYRSTDTGATFSPDYGGFTGGNVSSLSVSGTNILGGTLGGFVFLSADSGTTWTEIDNNMLSGPITSFAISGTNIFAGTGGGGVFLSTDTGTTWTTVNNGLTNTTVTSLDIIGTNIFAGTNGGGVFISPDTGTTWMAFNNGLTDPTIFSLAIISGEYILAGTGTAGVWKRISIRCVPVIYASSATALCQGQSVTLSDSLGSGYLWSNGETTQSIVVTTAGNYSCNVTSCRNTSNILSVTVINIISLSGSTTLCQGESVTLTAGSASSYLWSDRETTQSIVVTTAGNYSCNVTSSACGIINTDTIVITVDTLSCVITPGGATVCEGDSVVLTSSTATSYNWSNGATTQSITVKSTDNYSVIVTDANGCSAGSDTISVTFHSNPPPPTINQDGNYLISSDTTGNQWYLNDTIISGATGQLYIPAQSGIYTVEYTNGNGCSSFSAPFNFIFTGIYEAISDYSFSIYPNPAGNQLTVVIANPASAGKQSIALDIYNVIGEKVFSSSLSGVYPDNFGREGRGEAIDVSILPAGMYFIQMKSESAIDTKRFVKE